MATCSYSKILRGWPVAVILLTLCLLVVGCGSPRARYRMLSFFFDGVPDPDAPKAGSGVIRSAGGQTFFIHKPFLEEKCDACHQNTSDIFARAQVSTASCVNCHAPVLKAYPVMHGPVASLFCLKCHEGHQSVHSSLLKDTAAKLCTQCHTMTDLSQAVPAHRDVKTSCISCHSGHGGPTHKLLKASILPPTANPTTAPAAWPATEPTTSLTTLPAGSASAPATAPATTEVAP